MTDHAQRAHARRAITCLYLQLPESIAKDVEEIIEAAFTEDEKRITLAHAQGRREGMEESATVVEGMYLKPEHIWDADTLDGAINAIRAKAKEAGHE